MNSIVSSVVKSLSVPEEAKNTLTLVHGEYLRHDSGLRIPIKLPLVKHYGTCARFMRGRLPLLP